MANKRALIVDDSTTAQYRLKKMLRDYPLEIDVADSGEAALRYLAHNVPAVIFMDHSMPGMDGLRALQIIKSHPETAIIPVIMYTAQSGALYTGQARALGALDVVSKDSINATELSKVMNAIHIYTSNSAEYKATQDTNKQPAPTHTIELDKDGTDQTRNLELRLNHLEYTMDDSRRFITARLLKELQGLRQSLGQEFTNLMQHQSAAESPKIPPSKKMIITSLSILLLFLIIVIYLVFINGKLNQTTQYQAELNQQLQTITSQAAAKATAPANLLEDDIIQPDYFEDLLWTFNQNNLLQFQQNTLDTKPILRLNELLHRISSKGFTGELRISLNIGNFCIAYDSVGAAQLAKTGTTLSDCILSSELYRLERVAEEYSQKTKLILDHFIQDQSQIQLNIVTREGTIPYPYRLPTTSADDWNRVAQQNNAVLVEWVPAQEPITEK